jgi:signal transduction histidine kinase
MRNGATTAARADTLAGSPAADVFPGDSEMAARCRAFDWASTPLGPAARWPESLRTAARLVLAHPFPHLLLWGPALVQLYNDGYRTLIGDKHPTALGRPTHACWPEFEAVNAPRLARVLASESLAFEDELFPITRAGVREDAWFTFSYSPVRAEAGDIAGVLVTVFETTGRRRAEAALRQSEERQAFLLGLGDALRQLSDPVEVQAEAARLLGLHLGASRVHYAEISGDGAVGTVTSDYHVGVPSVVGQHRLDDYGPAAMDVFRSGRTLVVADVHTDARLTPPERAATSALAIGAYVMVPLVKAGRVAAVLVAHHAAPHAWTADEVALVDATAERTWGAVERARAEAALREREGKYRLIFDAIDEGLCVVEVLFDADGRPADYRFLEANRLFEEQTGLASPVGRTARELVPGLEAHWFETYGRIARTGVPERFQNGAESMGRWFDVFAFRVGAAEERRVGILFKDVSAARAAARERERLLTESEAARAEAEAANRAKSDFLAVMSHELRTPLNAIGGYAELLELGIHGPVTGEQRIALDRIRKSQQHLLGLVNDVLNYARVEAGAVYYRTDDVPLDEVLATCEALVAPQARARGLTLRYDACAPGLRVRADREKLQQVVLNLLSNAVKFTEPGGRIDVRCAVDEAAVRVAVADTGIGIAAEELARVFEPFVQVDARLTRTREGTGLGLAISRDLARGMGGDLTVESTPGEGSTFTLTLPRAIFPA